MIDVEGHKISILAQVKPEQTFSIRITLDENVLDYIIRLYLKRMLKLSENESKYVTILTSFKPWCVQSKALFEVLNQMLYLRPLRTLVDENSIEYPLAQGCCCVEAALLEKYGYVIRYALKDEPPNGPSYIPALTAYASLDPHLGFRFLNLNARVNSKHYKYHAIEEPVESRAK